MGLDSVAILMKVEHTFDIAIPYDEAEKIITVGDFHNAVWKQISGKKIERCKSQALFYDLRNLLCQNFSVSREDVRPDSSPEQIFPEVNRRQVYLNFSDSLRMKLPALELAKPWSNLLFAFGIATVVGGLTSSLILINIFDYSTWTLLIPLFGIAITILFSELLNPKRVRIPQATVRQFTEHVFALNYAQIVNGAGVHRRDMESVINHIIADMGGLELIEITPEKKIGDDLGID